MKELFINKRFSAASQGIIQQANDIIAEYHRQGFTLTLRQLYYQFVARALIPNNMRSYKRLGTIVSDGRLAGEIDWDAIEDRTRNLQRQPHWDSPASIIRAAAESYAIDMWENQPARVEVWIEKEALIGIVERVCKRYDVPYFACRGYVSQSEQYMAGQRFADHVDSSQYVVILHFGDHDPSGIDMTRDNDDSLGMFSGIPMVKPWKCAA